MANTNSLILPSDGAGRALISVPTLSVDQTYVLPNTGATLLPGDIVSTLANTEVTITGTNTATLNRWHVCSGTSADYTLALPTAVGNAGKFIGIRIDTACTKLITIDGNSTETIDATLTRIMWAGESALLLSDGANWFKVAGKSLPMRVILHPASNQTWSAGAYTLMNFTTLSESSCPAAFVTAATPQVTIQRPGIYHLNLNMMTSGTNSTSTNVACEVYKNGAVAFDTSTNYIGTVGYAAAVIGVTAGLAAGDALKPYGFYGSGSFTTSVLYIAASANYFSVCEIPNW